MYFFVLVFISMYCNMYCVFLINTCMFRPARGGGAWSRGGEWVAFNEYFYVRTARGGGGAWSRGGEGVASKLRSTPDTKIRKSVFF
jgi:hypothetical protein